MRIRLFGIVAMMVTVMGLVGYSLGAPQALAQTGTPAAKTPISLPTTAPTKPAEPVTTPTSETAATPLSETAATPVAAP